MRKLFVNPFIMLTLIASMLMVSSCETSGDIVEADLIGTWDIGQASVDIKVGPISLFNFLKTTMMFADEAAQALVDQLTEEFLEIGGGTVTFNADYSYHMARNQLEESGVWKLEEDQLFLTITGESLDEDPFRVNSLSATSAIVAWEQDQELVAGEGLPSFTATIIVELNLSKQ